MRLSHTLAIARREYLERLRSKGFWIGTVALPGLVLALALLPTLLLGGSDPVQRLAVIDDSGDGVLLGTALNAGRKTTADAPHFEIETVAPTDDRTRQSLALDQRVRAGELDGWLRLSKGLLDRNVAEYHSDNVSNFLTQARLTEALSTVVNRRRLVEAGFDPAVIAPLTQNLELLTIKITKGGSRAESAESGVLFAYILFFMLYMVLVVYGQQIMISVLEEKTTRIVEVVISCVTPLDLMLGKLVGIGAVALTQLGIWLAALAAITMPPILAAIAWIPEGFTIPTLPPALAFHFLALFLLGFAVYATFYAAAGAASNNVQEAQQIAYLVVFFLVAPMLCFWLVVNDPDSTASTLVSLVPLFTPLLMLLRIAVKTPPHWQIALGYLLTTAFAWLMIVICARIYRLGILMHGKKPSLRELCRWAIKG